MASSSCQQAEYIYELLRNYKGELTAPETIIKNYPVQGLGADLMSIARVSFYKRWRKEKIDGLLVNTVHDDIVCDIHSDSMERVASLFRGVFRDINLNFYSLFRIEFNIPLKCEISIGNNMGELTEVL